MSTMRTDEIIDESETIFLSFNIKRNKANPSNETNQEVARQIPPKHDTALPPLNPAKQG